MILHKVVYNSQRNNINFNGKFSGWRQCFTSCAWMLMSYYSKDIKGGDDEALSIYFDDVEDSVGHPGIGERIKMKFKWIRGKTSYWWKVQQEGIEHWLWQRGVKGNAIFQKKIKFQDLYRLIQEGPVIIGTKKMGGLKGGHIILCVGKNVYHDPFGDAKTNYRSHIGANVVYPREFLEKYTGEEILCIYWKKK